MCQLKNKLFGQTLRKYLSYYGFLLKNQHTQRKLLNFENWCNDELSKIGHHFSNKMIFKLMLSKNVNNKKCAPKLVFFNEKN